MNLAKVKNFFLKNYPQILATLAVAAGIIISVNYNRRLPRLITPTIPYSELDSLELRLDQEHAQLKEQIASINESIDAREQLVKEKTVSEALVEEVESLKDRVGLTQAKGKGITVTLDDADNRNADAAQALSHATDMRDLVDRLWAAGASAISIQGEGSKEERIGPTTSIECLVSVVSVGGTKMVPPFKIRAIGNPTALVAATQDREALKNIYDRVDKVGLKFNVETNANLTIEKFTGNITADYAKIK